MGQNVVNVALSGGLNAIPINGANSYYVVRVATQNGVAMQKVYIR